MKYQVRILIDVIGPELPVEEPVPQQIGDQIVMDGMELFRRYLRGHNVGGVRVQIAHPAKGGSLNET